MGSEMCIRDRNKALSAPATLPPRCCKMPASSTTVRTGLDHSNCIVCSVQHGIIYETMHVVLARTMLYGTASPKIPKPLSHVFELSKMIWIGRSATYWLCVRLSMKQCWSAHSASCTLLPVSSFVKRTRPAALSVTATLSLAVCTTVLCLVYSIL